MVLNGNDRVVVEVKRSYANVYDVKGEYYNRFPLSNDFDLRPGDYTGFPVFDYINYKDKRSGEFKSFIVLSAIDVE